MFDPREYVAKRKPMVFRFHRLNCAPTVVIDMDVEIEAALRYKAALTERPEAQGVRVTLNHIVLRATALALSKHILFNYDYNGRFRLLPNDKIDLRSPIEVGELPVHVVVPDTDKKSVFEIARVWEEKLAETRRFVQQRMDQRMKFERLPVLPGLLSYARLASLPLQKLIPPWERAHFKLLRMFMGSFMVTNVGTLGVTACHGQLVRPSVAALIVLAMRDEVRVIDGVPTVTKVLPLALEYDRKLADAGMASEFLKDIKRNLEHPEEVL